MLLLNRKINQKIEIEGGIEITVVKCSDKRVVLGINAPDHIRVDRKEAKNKKIK